MTPKHIFLSSFVLASGLMLASCSEDLDSPVLPEAPGLALPEAQPIDAGKAVRRVGGRDFLRHEQPELL